MTAATGTGRCGKCGHLWSEHQRCRLSLREGVTFVGALLIMAVGVVLVVCALGLIDPRFIWVAIGLALIRASFALADWGRGKR